ncbi:hypothetical protein [Klebsiella pneumoniae]|uniref:hypothetical protein n=1 Tax=Klebsiella pneumoniae TaxID=573 RepID=UPI002DC002EA|nr:hypothetical protein [Klebsiella pneumoniae]MEB7574106.1 hypothetical protein [Klebsiella pneumoniae]
MRITPPHLQPVLSRVKRFVERMPEGATLTQISQKVQAYSLLNKRDKEILIGIIRDSGLLVVANDGRTTTLHHPKFGHQAVNSEIPVKTEEPVVIKKTVTPDELRRYAEELIRAAEDAEKKFNDRAEIKKQLDPLRRMEWQVVNLMSLLMLWRIWGKRYRN